MHNLSTLDIFLKRKFSRKFWTAYGYIVYQAAKYHDLQLTKAKLSQMLFYLCIIVK